MKGLLDTGVDVTVIPKRRWPAHWELQPMAFIKGAQLARISKNLVQMEGLDRELDTLRPFVADYEAPLWGGTPCHYGGHALRAQKSLEIFIGDVEHPTQKLNWTTDSSIWVDQWPLSKEKFKALNNLMEEQLAQGNIEPTFRPWNSLVFAIKKPGKEKWWLLHELHKINRDAFPSDAPPKLESGCC